MRAAVAVGLSVNEKNFFANACLHNVFTGQKTNLAIEYNMGQLGRLCKFATVNRFNSAKNAFRAERSMCVRLQTGVMTQLLVAGSKYSTSGLFPSQNAAKRPIWMLSGGNARLRLPPLPLVVSKYPALPSICEIFIRWFLEMP